MLNRSIHTLILFSFLALRVDLYNGRANNIDLSQNGLTGRPNIAVERKLVI
jgi:hypothetical protein